MRSENKRKVNRESRLLIRIICINFAGIIPEFKI